MYPGAATRSKTGPVMPGTAALTLRANSGARMTAALRTSSPVNFCMSRMAALLVNPDFGHHAAEVFCIVGQVIELRRVQVVRARGVRRRAAAVSGPHLAGIQDHVDGLGTAQRDRGRVVIEGVSVHVPQQSRG